MTTKNGTPHPQPKRHHYLAISYLKRFSFVDNEKEYVVVHHRDRGFIDPQQPENVASITKQNVLLDPDGEEDFSLELALGEIESALAPVMIDIEARNVPTAEDRKWLSRFVGTMVTRTPEGINSIQSAAEEISGVKGIAAFANPEHVYRLLRALTRNVMGEEEASHIAAIASKQALDPKPKANGPFKPAVLVAYAFGVNLAEELEKRNFTIVRSSKPEVPFITSDAPAVFRPGTQPLIDGNGIDPWSSQCLIMMPLSSKLLLAIHGHGTQTTFKEADDQQVLQSNLIVAGNRWEWVFGVNKEVIRSVVDSPDVANRAEGARMKLVNPMRSDAPRF